jgi:LysR family transcriptional regulator, transcriptional activator of nhaA
MSVKWMNLQHLKYFLTIAEEGTLSAASTKLLVGQPALSAQLKQLEDWLGVQLFERKGKRLHITPTGEYVLKYAKAIKGLEDELISNMGHAEDTGFKEITLGIQESVPKSIMADTISTLKKTHPLHVKVIEGNGEELFDLLIGGKIDGFIGNFKPMSTSREVIYTSLESETLSIWGAKKFAKLKRNFPDSLDGADFILPGFQNQLRHDFEKYMLQNGLKFEISVEAQDTALQKELASRGEGLLVMGEDSVKAWAGVSKLQKIGSLPNMKEEYWLGMLKKNLDNEFIKSVMGVFSKR